MKREMTLIGGIFLMIGILSACQKEDQTVKNITGLVQKGPFVNGSSITVFDLNSDLSQSGKSYNAQIKDDKGAFELNNVSLTSNYVSLKADGFYYNEVTGKQSGSQLTLYGISDISGRDKINVNVLTTLEKARVENLMKNGKSFSAAKSQAQKEILSIFNLSRPTIENSEDLNIATGGDDNGILLAISSILQGYRSESELTKLLSDISNDLAEDGILNDTTLGSELMNHAIYLVPEKIKTNLSQQYHIDTAGFSSFGKYIDQFKKQSSYPVTKSLIDYPQTGTYGDNILHLSGTEYPSGMDVYQSLAVNLPENMTLMIKITSTSHNFWYNKVSSIQNWSVTTFDMDTYSQTFTAIDPGKSCDLRIRFDPGTFRVDYYEMGASTPTHTKTITVK